MGCELLAESGDSNSGLMSEGNAALRYKRLFLRGKTYLRDCARRVFVVYNSVADYKHGWTVVAIKLDEA